MRIISLSSRFLKKERKYPILKYREDGEFRLLIKEQRDYQGRFKVYFRISVAQFDASDTRATYKKKKRPPISVNSVCKDLYTVLCATIWSGWTWQSPFWILAFACTVALNYQNASQNACYGCEKHNKSNPILIFFYGRKFRRQCVNMIDITWGCIYFSRCEHFGRKFRTQCAMTFTVALFCSCGLPQLLHRMITISTLTL